MGVILILDREGGFSWYVCIVYLERWKFRDVDGEAVGVFELSSSIDIRISQPTL